MSGSCLPICRNPAHSPHSYNFHLCWKVALLFVDVVGGEIVDCVIIAFEYYA